MPVGTLAPRAADTACCRLANLEIDVFGKAFLGLGAVGEKGRQHAGLLLPLP